MPVRSPLVECFVAATGVRLVESPGAAWPEGAAPVLSASAETPARVRASKRDMGTPVVRGGGAEVGTRQALFDTLDNGLDCECP